MTLLSCGETSVAVYRYYCLVVYLIAPFFSVINAYCAGKAPYTLLLPCDSLLLEVQCTSAISHSCWLQLLSMGCTEHLHTQVHHLNCLDKQLYSVLVI